jgi:hypothetical protein
MTKIKISHKNCVLFSLAAYVNESGVKNVRKLLRPLHIMQQETSKHYLSL